MLALEHVGAAVAQVVEWTSKRIGDSSCSFSCPEVAVCVLQHDNGLKTLSPLLLKLIENGVILKAGVGSLYLVLFSSEALTNHSSVRLLIVEYHF